MLTRTHIGPMYHCHAGRAALPRRLHRGPNKPAQQCRRTLACRESLDFFWTRIGTMNRAVAASRKSAANSIALGMAALLRDAATGGRFMGSGA